MLIKSVKSPCESLFIYCAIAFLLCMLPTLFIPRNIHFMNNTCIAINTHDNDMKGLNLSPIRLSFQQNPDIPFLFITL